MHFEGRRRSSAIPNLTPLIDVVFLLLVFFMLTSHFVDEKRVPVELPRAASAADPDPARPLEIALTADGGLLLAGEPVPRDGLAERLRSALAGRESQRIRLRGDRAADLGGAVLVLDAARAVGAEAVDIVAEQP